MNKKQETPLFDQQKPSPESKEVAAADAHDRHICLFFTNQDEQWHMMRDYLVEHLSADLPVVYAQDSTPAELLMELLHAEGLPVQDLIARGILQIFPAKERYLATGQFDYQSVLAFMEATIQRLQALGYDRMLITGETRWWLPNVPGAEKLMNYEALLNPLVEKYPGVTILCLYDLRRFEAPTMLNLLLTHQSIHIPNGRVPGYYGL